MDFILLCTGYFCILFNILKWYFGTQIIGNSLMLLDLTLQICEGGTGFVYSPVLRPFWVLQPMPCELWGFPVWSVGTALFLLHVSAGYWSLESFWAVLSLGLDVFCHMCALTSSLMDTCRELLAALCVLSLCHSSTWHSVLWTSTALVSLDSQLWLLSLGRTPHSASIPPSCSAAWTLPWL